MRPLAHNRIHHGTPIVGQFSGKKTIPTNCTAYTIRISGTPTSMMHAGESKKKTIELFAVKFAITFSISEATVNEETFYANLCPFHFGHNLTRLSRIFIYLFFLYHFWCFRFLIRFVLVRMSRMCESLVGFDAIESQWAGVCVLNGMASGRGSIPRKSTKDISQNIELVCDQRQFGCF